MFGVRVCLSRYTFPMGRSLAKQVMGVMNKLLRSALHPFNGSMALWNIFDPLDCHGFSALDRSNEHPASCFALLFSDNLTFIKFFLIFCEPSSWFLFISTLRCSYCVEF